VFFFLFFSLWLFHCSWWNCCDTFCPSYFTPHIPKDRLEQGPIWFTLSQTPAHRPSRGHGALIKPFATFRVGHFVLLAPLRCPGDFFCNTTPHLLLPESRSNSFCTEPLPRALSSSIFIYEGTSLVQPFVSATGDASTTSQRFLVTATPGCCSPCISCLKDRPSGFATPVPSGGKVFEPRAQSRGPLAFLAR